jgi:hypothetical protein
MSPSRILQFIFFLGPALLALNVQALTVVSPTASSVVAAGDDYATQVLGNAWDMSDTVDVSSQESIAIASQTVAASVFSGTTSANGAYLYPVFMGYPSSINLSRGANHPIDTSHYRYVTFKIRVNQPSQPQFTRVVGLLDGNSYAATPKLTVAESFYSAQLPNNSWTIVTFDMVTNNDNVFYHWTDFPQLTGLRIDPATTNAGGAYANVPFSIDWVRLTAPATSAQKTSVQWTDSPVSTYNVSAIDSVGTSFLLASNVGGTSLTADTSFLPPGQYQIQVSRTNNTASALSSAFRINTPPQIAITAPSVRGDQSKSFAATIVGNPWGPIDATDFSNVINFKNVSYATPAGSFYGRPTNNDPNLFFNLAGHAIDTSVYRSMCVNMEVSGPRNIGLGSVARIFWGNTVSALTTSDDIVLDDNLGDTVVSEYCIPDLAAANVVDPAQPALGGAWSGTKTLFRIDPDELSPPGGCATKDTCHDVQLDSLVLSPFAHANPGFTFTWVLNDVDNAAPVLRLALDPDTNPKNGNEFVIYNQTVSTGNGSFPWSGSPGAPTGTYHVLATVDDGINPVDQYAGGVIVVTSDVIFRDGFE